MGIANILSVSRIVLSIVVYVFFTIGGDSFIAMPSILAVVLVIQLYIEASDIIDGALARRTNSVSDLGKLLDPFADVLCRFLGFSLFVRFGVLDQWILVLFSLREFLALFIRMSLVQRSIVLPAGPWGKLKTIVFGIAGFPGYVAAAVMMGGEGPVLTSFPWLELTWGLVALGLVFSYIALAQYIRKLF